MLHTQVYVIPPEAASSHSPLRFFRHHIDLHRVRGPLCHDCATAEPPA
ncbi:hypothetical protein Pth03_38970 [Planotetraspora thailandica]|uniref:Uncharacterized protein n=1 Tax=Planotetraspora thailandica TaxID=487172 RepID=A0A8J3V2E6_9ACTN|nr:hypothetical protein [Planotetraspora thailandica]GII55508.1 hypothetical protein Pth03_38970 [Planotetraspora thailandica]